MAKPKSLENIRRPNRSPEEQERLIQEFKKKQDHIFAKIFQNPVFKFMGVVLFEYEFIPFYDEDMIYEEKEFIHKETKERKKFTCLTSFGSAYIVYAMKQVYINLASPDFENLETLNLASILCHEIGHKILYHDLRSKKKSKKLLFNLAGDYIINLLLHDLQECTKMKLISSEFLDNSLCREEFRNRTEEELYNMFINNGNYKEDTYDAFNIKMPNGNYYTVQATEIEFKYKEDYIHNIQYHIPESESNQEDGGDGDQGGESSGGNGDDKDDEKEKDGSGSGQGKDKEPKNNLPTIDMSKMKPKNQNNNQNGQGKSISLARHMLQDMVSKGDISFDVKESIKIMLGMKIPWQEISESCIKKTVKIPGESTWAKQRMTSFANPSLPMLPGFQDQEKYHTVIWAFDQSGSITQPQLEESVSILLQSKQYFENLYVIKHDTEIACSEYKTRQIGEKQKKEIATVEKCGGTSHRMVFEKIRELWQLRRNEISCFIGLTDFYSDILECKDILPVGLPVIWLASTNYNKNIIQQLPGKVIIIND